MAEIEQLAAGQNPPEDQDWFLVEKGAAGGFYVSWSLAQGNIAVSKGNTLALATAKDAFDYAREHAAKSGVDTIYSKGVPNA